MWQFKSRALSLHAGAGGDGDGRRACGGIAGALVAGGHGPAVPPVVVTAVAVAALGLMSYGLSKPALANTPPATGAPAGRAAAGAPTARGRTAAPSATGELDKDSGIEIVAVGPWEPANHAWWSPSGGSTTFRPRATGPRDSIQAMPGMAEYELAVRMPPSIGARLDPSEGPRGNVRFDPDDVQLIRLELPVGKATVNLRIKYSSDPWQTVRTIQPSSAKTGAQTTQGLTLAFGGFYETRDALSMVVADDIVGMEFDRRFTAVEKDGHETQKVGSTVGGEKFDMSRVDFPNLKLANVQAVRCEIRPRGAWVEFDGIALRSGTEAKPTIKRGKVEVPETVQAQLKTAASMRVPPMGRGPEGRAP